LRKEERKSEWSRSGLNIHDTAPSLPLSPIEREREREIEKERIKTATSDDGDPFRRSKAARKKAMAI
jgi:hypothetical protein